MEGNEKMFLYFAYGSNMNPTRMERRCFGATPIGVGTLRNYKLSERLYADIDPMPGATVSGVLYLVTERHLKRLDLFEGCPRIYRSVILEIEFEGRTYHAVTYEMSEETKQARNGQPYPEEYRKICSEGARFHHIADKFTQRRRRA